MLPPSTAPPCNEYPGPAARRHALLRTISALHVYIYICTGIIIIISIMHIYIYIYICIYKDLPPDATLLEYKIPKAASARVINNSCNHTNNNSRKY